MSRKKGIKRYGIKVFTKMRDPFSLLYSGGQRSFVVDKGLTKRDAVREIKAMKTIYPSHFKYRIVRKKGLFGLSFLLGVAVFLFCLAIANITPDIFSFSNDIEEMLRMGFIVLGIFCLLAGLFKSL